MGRKEWATHVGHNGPLSDTSHSVFDVFFNESAEPGVIELGRLGTGISRTVFSKLDNLITGDKTNRQEIHGTGNGR